MGCSRKTILIVFACAVLVQTISCGDIIEKVKEDIGKGVRTVDCAFKSIGDFLGIGKKCEKKVEPVTQGTLWQGQGKLEETTYGPSGFNQGFGQSGYGQQSSVGQNGYGQNSFGQGNYDNFGTDGFNRGQSGYGSNGPSGGYGQNSFGQNGFGRPNGFNRGQGNNWQNSGYGENGFGQGGYDGFSRSNGQNGQNNFGQGGYDGSNVLSRGQGYNGQNGGYGQNNFGQGASDGLNQGSTNGQGSSIPNFGFNDGNLNRIDNIPTASTIGSFDTKSSVVTESTSTNEIVTKDSNKGLDMRFQQGDTSSTSIDTTTKLNMHGRRIISAHSNCGPGYVADSRGRCRETF